MRILSIVWFKVLPAKYGGQKGTANFNKYLANHCELIVLAAKANKTDETLNYRLIPELPNGKLQFINPFTWYKIYKTAKAYKAEILILEYPYHAIAGIIVKKLLKLKLVLHEHNIEFERFSNLGKWWWPIMKWYEILAFRASDLIIFKTGEDQLFVVNNYHIEPSSTFPFPYSVERNPGLQQSGKELRQKIKIPENSKMLLFAGTIDYKPNAEAVEDIYQYIAPALPEGFYIIITGRNTLKQFKYLRNYQHTKVIQAGEVDSLEEYYSAADCFINPVMEVHGIQTKILDALAAGLNIVSFKDSMKGIQEIPGKTYIVDTGNWQEFISNIKLAISSQIPVPDTFYDDYSWGKNMKRMVDKLNVL